METNKTLINEFGDRIESVITKVDYRTPKRKQYLSYRCYKLKAYGGLNKVKKAVNDMRGKKTTWQTIYE